jgi:hypothetical protein
VKLANFPDDPNETEKTEIAKVGYLGNAQRTEYSVLRVIQRKLKKLNLAIIAQNRLRALPKMESLLRESQYFWRKFQQKPQILNFCKVSQYWDKQDIPSGSLLYNTVCTT